MCVCVCVCAHKDSQKVSTGGEYFHKSLIIGKVVYINTM